MNQAKLYQRANNVQRHDAQKIIEEFSSVFQWRLNGNDKLLDVGTGSGDVLMEIIRPIIPKNFKRITGSDVSSEMIRHCKNNYSQVKNVDFKILDIGTEKLPREFVGEFDHVTSFYCLQWVQNQRQAMENIYQMLQADGDCLLVFLAAHPFFDVYKIISTIPKWAQFMTDVDSFISPLQYSKDPEGDVAQLLEDAGFVDFNVEMREQIYVYEGLETIRNNTSAVNAFIDRIPTEMREEFLDEMINTTANFTFNDQLNDDYRFAMPYTLMVVYAKKN